MTAITAIELPHSFDSYQKNDGQPVRFLEPISHINIFVGPNNSGKSRFMRYLAAQGDYKVVTDETDLNKINSQIKTILEEIQAGMAIAGFEEVNDITSSRLSGLMTLPQAMSLANDDYKNIRETFQKWSGLSDISSSRLSPGKEGNGKNFKDLIKNKAAEALKVIENVPINSESGKHGRIYIPTLRGLRPIDDPHKDLYQSSTRTNYFFSPPTKEFAPEIFSGLSLYTKLTDMLLGNNSERKIIADYQNFISKTLFEGKSVTLIPDQRNNKAIIVKIGNEQEQPIFHLGDGIQSAIILSFLPYITKEPTFFFIEEPEIYLHPGLQRKILSFFASLSQHTFFLTTHSNHLLDLTFDIRHVSIFTFRKFSLSDTAGDEQIPTFAVEAVDSGDTSSLELLGVRNSSVFLVNATIWVEGITDRLYLRQMLNSYLKYLGEQDMDYFKIEEDVHFSFVEYGGGNINHWSFLDDEEHPIEVDRLCAKALVIVDKDGETKFERKEKLLEILNDRLIILSCREIENLLPYPVLKSVILDYEKTPDRKLPDIDYASYQNERLAPFIEDKILEGNYVRKGGYKGKYNVLKTKVAFCEKALPKIKYSELPSTTQELVKKIYEFICSQNK